MVDRIREVLSVRKLTPTQFADTIGIARPIISHILSGRNKPSLEVVQKIIEAFPELSLSWLLRGTGSILAAEAASGPGNASATVSPARRAGPKGPETARLAPAVEIASAESAVASVEAPTLELPPLLPFPAPMAAEASAPASSPSPLAPPLNHVVPAFFDNVSVVSKPLTTTDPSAAVPHTVAAPSVAPPAVAPPLAAPDKAIRRIVIFYHDGTFTDYQPEHK